ncbi:MAG: glycosyltransferase [bacterium]|nr:glycosyltransferase [bacterium]
MKRILILYGFEYSGHHSAALALREAFRAADPSADVRLLNFFRYASRLLERVSTKAFYRMVKSTPSLWDGIYTDPRSEARFSRFRGLVRTLAPRGVEDAVRAHEPDAVVCTQSFPCGMVSDFKERHGSDLPLHAVLTDFFVPSYWVYGAVDRYFVACREALDDLAAAGIGRDRAADEGIPISPAFAEEIPKAEARRRFGLPPDGPVVAVMGGWSGWGALERLALETARVLPGCTVVVATGRNREQYEALLGRAAAAASRITVLPYVRRPDILMRAADVMVGKAGGLTAAEALASGLPLVLVDSLPGQERANADYLCRGGAALAAGGADEAAAIVADLFARPDRLGRMRLSALGLSRPAAAASIARTILEEAHAPVRCV